MKSITLHTDGAASGNPGPGGFGALLTFNGLRKELSGGFARTTNNRMEILAALAGLESLREPCKVTVISDSRYLVDAMTKGWLRGWKARGWSRAHNQHLKNADLWKRLDAAAAPHENSSRWVKGHAGHPETERCDSLADAAARRGDLPDDKAFLAEEDHMGSQGEMF